MPGRENKPKFEEIEKPTKEEYAVAKFLRFNMPTKKAILHKMEVHCFYASGAVDALLQSEWSASKNPTEPLFETRESCITYCQRLIEKGLFHRAVQPQRKKDKAKGERSKKKRVKDTPEKEDGGEGDEVRERKSKKKAKEENKEDEEADPEKTTAESQDTPEQVKTEEKKDGKKKKEKPLELIMTDDQMFLDGEENIYVWIYDPPSAKTLFIGSLIVFGSAAVCLYPLWPECVRVGVYYVSLASAVFLGFILSLIVLRQVVFCVVWLATLGRHHFWMLPTLTEDVGLLESFTPLYTHSVVTPSQSLKAKKKASRKGGKKKREKGSDREEEGGSEESGQEFEMISPGDLQDEGEEEEEENREAGSEEEEEEGDEYGEEEEEEEEESQNEGGEEEEEGEEKGEEEGGEEKKKK